MAIVEFYEKPGCLNNAKQKQLLTAAGHMLIVHDLLQHPWANDRAKLRSFFGNLPVREWFNSSAPPIKNGEIHPEMLNEREVIELMISNPLLIRRPLIEVDGQRRAGFDMEMITDWLGLQAVPSQPDRETCPKQHGHQTCRS